MLAIGFVTTVSRFCFYMQHLTLCLSLCCLYFDASCTLYQNSNFVRTNLRNAGFAQRIPTLREKLRNPGIARQSTDSYFAQRSPKIARLPGLRGTYIFCCFALWNCIYIDKITSPSSSKLHSMTIHLLWHSEIIFQKSFTVVDSGPWVAM